MRHILRGSIGIAVLAASAAFVPAAQAGTIQVIDGTAVFTAAPGEKNDIRAGTGLHAAPGFPLKLIDSGAPLTAGPGCVQLDASSAQCPASTVHSPLAIWTGDQADKVFVDDALDRPDVTVHGGAGNDDLHVGSAVGTSPALYGGRGDDTLSVSNNIAGTPTMHGGRGDDTLTIAEDGGGLLYGDAGDDQLMVGNGSHDFATIELHGGRGDDSIMSIDGVFDTVGCGAGTDAVDADSMDFVGQDCETVTRT